MGGYGFPSEGAEAITVKDTLSIMISFATFVIALLTYIAINYKRK